MASEDNNPLKPLQHTGLSADDKALLRNKLIDLMQAEEAADVPSEAVSRRRRDRSTQRLSAALAGAAAVVVAGVIVVNGVNGSHGLHSTSSASGSSSGLSLGTAQGGTTTGHAASLQQWSASAPNHAAGSSSTSATAPANVAPMQITGFPGSLQSMQSWPLKGEPVQNTGGPMPEVQYSSSSGFTIGGVHWTWPSSDTNPSHYIVVPTTVDGKPFLVWSHLGAQKKLGNPNDGGPNTIEPTAASSLYMTPWNAQGGSLQAGAQLVTGNIPPVFSTSGQYVFPSNPKDSTPSSLAGTAWTGWFQWGSLAPSHEPAVNPSASPAPTMAWPNALYPAYNGVVLAVESQILLANQGGAVNLYYINLATHNIVGLASLTNGGGLFSAMRVVSGMVFTESSTDLTANGNMIAAAYIYNEATGQRVKLSASAANSANGFSDWTIHGGKVYDANGRLVADLHLPAAATNEPSAWTFGVSP